MKRIIVTGTARSGTLYTARLLARLGLSATHERVYNYVMDPDGSDHAAVIEAWRGKQIDVNWMAAPFLKHEPKSTVVWHQLRDPLKVVQCFHSHKMLADERAFAMELVRRTVPETRTNDQLEGAVAYCLRWHEMIDAEKKRLPVLFYRIESMTPELLRYLLDASGIDESLLCGESIEEALAATPKNVNSCPHHLPLGWSDIKGKPLGWELAALTERYGYPC